MKTARNPTPPKAEATADNIPPLSLASAPKGSLPDAGAVESIRELTKEVGRLEVAQQEATRKLIEPERLVRDMLHANVSTRDNPYEIPVSTLWDLLEKENRTKRIPHFADFKEAYERYKAALSVVETTRKRYDEKSVQLRKLLLVEGPKLSTAMRERHTALVEEIRAKVLPYCDGPDAANSLAESTDKAQSLNQRIFSFVYTTGTAVVEGSGFLTAYKEYVETPLQTS